MDGEHMRLLLKLPIVMDELSCRSCENTHSIGQLGFGNKAAGRETRLVGGVGVVCIRRLVMLLREVDVIRRGAGLEVSLDGLALVGLPGSFT